MGVLHLNLTLTHPKNIHIWSLKQDHKLSNSIFFREIAILLGK